MKKTLLKRAFAILLTFAMLLGSLTALNGAGISSVSASGKDLSPAANNNPNAVLDKNVWLTEDGTYTIELSAYTKGDVEINSIISTVPVDVILLLDQSYSMADHGTLLGRSFDCYHTTAIKEASKRLISMLSTSATNTANHRMAIAAYGCENTLLAQYFPGNAGATNSLPYAGSELYVGGAKYRYNGDNCSFNYDPWSYQNENNIGTITAEGVDYYGSGPYPPASAQAHYGEAMLDVRSQKEELFASINAYNPNPSNHAERGGTAMHVGMKMVEGIMDAYRPNPVTHENMYFKPDPNMPAFTFVPDESSKYSYFFESASGNATYYVADPNGSTTQNVTVCGPDDEPCSEFFWVDFANGNEYNGTAKGFYTYARAQKARQTKGNWIRGRWVENEHITINGVDVYGSWENRKKVVIIFTDGYVGDTAFRPDWANQCMVSAGKLKNGTYGEPATIYTVGLIWDEPEEWVHDRLDVAFDGDTNDGIYKTYLSFSGNGRQVFNSGEYFPNHFFDSPHESLLKKFLGYISSNYIPNAQGQFPTQAVQYTGGYYPTLAVSNHDAGFRNPYLQPAHTTGGLFVDNYFIDAHNTLSDPNTADYENITRLVEAFEIISSEIITIEMPSSTGGGAALSRYAVLRDYLSNYFEMPEDFGDANVAVFVEDCDGINGEDYIFANRRVYESAVVGFDAEEGMVEVSNIEYVPCARVNNSFRGNKYTVTITGILAKSFAVGNDLPTNNDKLSGIYADSNSAEPGLRFPLPKVDIREKYVVYDFSTLLREEHSHEFFGKTATSHDVLEVLTLDDCYKSQSVGGDISYHTTYPYYGCTDYADKSGVFECNIIGDGFDHAAFKPKSISRGVFELGALLRCDPAKNDGVEYEWCKLTFLPATNVHYEEDCLNFFNGGSLNPIVWTPSSANRTGNWQLMGRGTSAGTQSSANGGLHSEYGFSTGYSIGGYQDSNGRSMHVKVDNELRQKVVNQGAQWPMVNFTFSGTGFDFISHSGSDTGVFSVDVVPHGFSRNDTSDPNSRHIIVNTYYSGEYLYQIPVLRVADLDWSEEGYDVFICALYIPAFARESKSGVIEAGTIPGLPKEIEYELVELNPGCEGIEERAESGGFDAFVDAIRIYNPRGVMLGSYSGVDYEAYYAANELNPDYVQLRSLLLADPNTDPSALYIDGQDGGISIEEYARFGPNNEAYLWAAPAGQHADKAIAFTVANWNKNTTRVHISAKAPVGIVRMYVNGVFVGDVRSATELYYDITDILRETTDTGHVVISAEQADNGPDHPVLSLVNVKIMEQTVTLSQPGYANVTWVDGFNNQILKTKTVRIGDWLETGDLGDFPAVPDHSAEGYVFERWDYNHAPVMADLTITAIYVPESVSFKVEFVDQITGLVFHTWNDVEMGTVLNTADFPEAPKHSGYRFIGHSYAANTPIYADTIIFYEYEEHQMVIVNFYVDPSSTAILGAQLLLDRDHNTYGTTVPWYVGASGSSATAPQQSWYDEMEYLLPTNAGVNSGVVANGGYITNFEIEPGTYDLFVLSSVANMNTWHWRGRNSAQNDIELVGGMVLNVRFNNTLEVSVSYGPNSSVQFLPDVGTPTRGSIKPSSGAAAGDGRYPIYADIETFNFAEAILAGVRGDANHDYSVDMTDALLVMRRALGCEVELDAYGRYCADCNRDSVIDLTDALFIMRSALETN